MTDDRFVCAEIIMKQANVQFEKTGGIKPAV